MTVGAFEDAWSQTEVRVVSPNEQVFVTIVGNSEIRVEILSGYVERMQHAQVREQIERAGRLALVERTQAFFGLRSEQEGQIVRPRSIFLSEEDAEYSRKMKELAVEGSSGDGSVRVFSAGLTAFTVDFPPGMSSEGLAAALSQAATALMADQISKAFDVKLEVYHGLTRD